MSLTTEVTRLLDESGYYGYTYREVGSVIGVGHGTVSAVLSDLHRLGVATRLTEKRGGCGVYVLVECAGERPTEKYRRVSGAGYCPECGHCNPEV